MNINSLDVMTTFGIAAGIVVPATAIGYTMYKAVKDELSATGKKAPEQKPATPVEP